MDVLQLLNTIRESPSVIDQAFATSAKGMIAVEILNKAEGAASKTP